MVDRRQDVPDPEARDTLGLAQPLVYARFGTVFCLVPDPAGESDDDASPQVPASDDVVKTLADSLQKDSRVVHVETPGENYVSMHNVFPFLMLDPLEPAPSVDEMREWALELARPILFRVSVPKKNQPGWEGHDAYIASDNYSCAWDGSMLVVMWESTDPSPYLGGQIVRDIVQEAIVAAGYEARIQGPSMAHVDVMVICDPAAKRIEATRLDWRLVEVTLPSRQGLEEALLHLYEATRFVVRAYYDVENSEEAFRSVSWLMEAHAQMLLRLQHRRAHVRMLPIRERISEYWKLRGTRAGLRDLVAKILLELAVLQEMRGDALNRISQYADTTRDWGFSVFFDDFVEREKQGLEQDDSHFAQSTIDHVAGRLDSRDVVLATLWGVLAGALLGVLATLIASAS